MDGGFSQELRYKNRQMCGEEWGGEGKESFCWIFLVKFILLGGVLLLFI